MVLVEASTGALTAGSKPDERNLRFVLSLTAAAAVLLALLSVAIRGLHLPTSSSMLAETPIRVEDARQQLDTLNHPAAAVTPTADQKAPETRK